MRKRHIVLALLIILGIITFLDRMCIAVSGPRMQADLGISTEHWGGVLGAFILSYGIFEIPVGAWGDRWGHRNVLSRIVLWWSVFACLTGAASGFISLLVIRFLFGAGGAGGYPNFAGVISRWFPRTERARAQGFVWGAGRFGAGVVASAEDYARYCKYLVARYGARPAIWLMGGDNPATLPSIVEQLDRAGNAIEEWDAYQQPTGIHYAPHSLNRTHQDKAWLDFQWCQTGHNGEHVPERVADMWRNTPQKAVANGEPTYENIGRTGRGAGWWQGHEAWSNLTAGSTMGLVYGAGSLWQWRLHAKEPDHADWCTAPGAGWREALD